MFIRWEVENRQSDSETSVHLFTIDPFNHSACMSVCMSVYLSVCLSVCLPVALSLVKSSGVFRCITYHAAVIEEDFYSANVVVKSLNLHNGLSIHWLDSNPLKAHQRIRPDDERFRINSRLKLRPIARNDQRIDGQQTYKVTKFLIADDLCSSTASSMWYIWHLNWSDSDLLTFPAWPRYNSDWICCCAIEWFF